MPTLEDLNAHTAEFFTRHWKEPLGEQPKWSSKWQFCGSIPNNGMQGCYAILNGEEIIYVGLGAGYGTDRYQHAGLGQRLHNYWRVHPSGEYKGDDRLYIPVENWQEATAIVTLGFEPVHSYLAHSLEQYLIRELNPDRNTEGKKRHEQYK